MKKFLLLILTLICSISLVACFGGESESTVESEEESTSQVESISESSIASEESESEESVSEPESEESVSESESEEESIVVTYTITFVVNGNVYDVKTDEEGAIVKLPSSVGEYPVKHWVNQATGDIFEGDEITLCEDLVLVAVISTEFGPY